MAETESSTLFGYRTDIDLNQRWWHRLAKVSYSLFAAITVILVALIYYWAGEGSLEAKYKNIKIITTLGNVYDNMPPTQANAVTEFLKVDGKLGLKNDAAKKMDYLLTWDLDRSICTPDTALHLADVVTVLNRRVYDSSFTESTVLDALRKQGHANADGILPPRLQLCWMAGSLKDVNLQSIAKYDFTTDGYYRAWFDVLGPLVFGLFVAHFLVLNLYYRGVVFVLVGPRTKTPEAPTPKVPEDEDEDESSIY